MGYVVVMILLLLLPFQLDAATKLGLHVTTEELALWRARRTDNTTLMNGFSFQAIYNTRILTEANLVRNQVLPNIDGIWVGYTGSGCAPTDNQNAPNPGAGTSGSPYGRGNGARLVKSAFVFLLTGDVTYATPVKAALLNQITQAGTNWTNSAKWCSAGSQNSIETIPWLYRLLIAYDYLNAGGYTGFTATEKNNIQQWFGNAATFFDTWHRNGANGSPYKGIYSTPQHFNCVGSGCTAAGPQLYFQGPFIVQATNAYNNVGGLVPMFTMAYGIMAQHSVFIDNSKRWIQAFMRVGIFDNGASQDFTRWGSFWAHIGGVWGTIGNAIDLLARTGDTYLYTYGGPTLVPNGSGGNVTWRSVVNIAARMSNKTAPLYYETNVAAEAVPSGTKVMTWDNGTPDKGQYFHFALMPNNVFYKDSALTTAMDRNIIGGNHPSTGCYEDQFGGCFSGVWGFWPDLPFMYGKMPANINPYTFGPTVSITTPTSNPTYTSHIPLTSLSGTVTGSNIASASWTCPECDVTSGTVVYTPPSSWSMSGLSPNIGTNTITVTALDSTNTPGSDQLVFTLTSSTPDITTGLIYRLPFEEGAGSTAADATGTQATTNLTGGFTWPAGLKGAKAIEFQGAGVGTKPGLLGNPSSFTIMGDIQLTGAGGSSGHTLLNIGDYAGIRVYPDRIRAFFFGAGFIQALEYFTTIGSGWNHVAYTHTPTERKVYLNGVEVATGTSTNVVWTGRGSNTTIGNHATGLPNFQLFGRLDEVKVYNRALSAIDIEASVTESPSPPTMTITSPSTNPFTTNTSVISLAGQVTDNVAVASVTGTCVGCITTSFTAVISGSTWTRNSVMLGGAPSTNVITLKALDNDSNETVITLTVHVVVAPAADYYVELTGSDTNDGLSVNTPWRTIQKAANTATAGKTVRVGAGTFTERVVINVNGTAGAPIIFQGSKSGDVYHTIVDGSVATSGWVAAPEIGAGVFKAALGSPQVLTSNGKNVQMLNSTAMGGATPSGADGNGDFYLSRAANATKAVLDTTINVWDGIEALYGNKTNGQTYLRFRNGENPSTMNVRVGPTGGVITINSKNYISIKDFEILGGKYGVDISGSSAGPHIRGNKITSGNHRVFIRGTADNVLVERNLLLPNMIGFQNFTPGDRQTLAAAGYPDRVINRHVYDTNKFAIGTTEIVESSIYTDDTASNIRITGNTIERGIAALHTSGSNPNVTFDNNICRYFADMCWYMNADNLQNFQFYYNDVQDSEHGIRLESSHRNHTLYIVGNRFWGPYYGVSGNGAMKHIFTGPPGAGVGQVSPMTTWVYHNSFGGSGWLMDMGATAEVSYSHPNLHVRNNLYSIAGGISSGGNAPIGDLQNNMDAGILWESNTPPTFWLPEGHSGINTAPSLAAFPLPWPEVDYFKGSAPDYGARQGVVGDPGPIPDPPIATRLVFLTQPASSSTCPSVLGNVQVAVLDQYDVLIAVESLVVTMAINANPGVATLQGTTAVATASGTSNFSDLCLTEPGVGYTLRATGPGVMGVTSGLFTMTEVPVAHRLIFVQQPIAGFGGTVLSPIIVHVVDENSQVVTDSTVEVTLAFAEVELANLGGDVIKNAVAGVATFNDLFIDRREVGYVLKATSPGLQQALSNEISIGKELFNAQNSSSESSISSIISATR